MRDRADADADRDFGVEGDRLAPVEGRAFDVWSSRLWRSDVTEPASVTLGDVRDRHRAACMSLVSASTGGGYDDAQPAELRRRFPARHAVR